jgi:hypothetical protein
MTPIAVVLLSVTAGAVVFAFSKIVGRLSARRTRELDALVDASLKIKAPSKPE